MRHKGPIGSHKNSVYKVITESVLVKSKQDVPVSDRNDESSSSAWCFPMASLVLDLT